MYEKPRVNVKVEPLSKPVKVYIRFRQQLRPQDPKDLGFELEMEQIPDNFFREDVKVTIFVEYDDGN